MNRKVGQDAAQLRERVDFEVRAARVFGRKVDLNREWRVNLLSRSARSSASGRVVAIFRRIPIRAEKRAGDDRARGEHYESHGFEDAHVLLLRLNASRSQRAPVR